MSANIVTLTLNPAVDMSSEAEQVRHTHKTRTYNEKLDPGGGGINVARVACRMGVASRAVYLAGGATGHVLHDLLDRRCIERHPVMIAGDTRMSLNVFERSSGREFRFVPEGPEITESEWRAMLDEGAASECDYLVASGSLPRGVPADFYADLAQRVAGRTRVVLDTSGPELRAALDAGGLFLVKPSRGELEELVGTPLRDAGALAEAASKIVASGKAEHVAVTLGQEGALLAGPDGVLRLPALDVEARSAVGAGDSFVAGMVVGFIRGLGAGDAFRLGVAAGTAAVLTPGTDLCHAEDVERLFGQVPQPS